MEPPRLRTGPPRPVPPLPRQTHTGFLDAYGPLLYFSLVALIPVLCVALLLYAPSGASFEPLTPDEWASLMDAPASPTVPSGPAHSSGVPTALHVESVPDGTLVYVDFGFGGITPYRTDEIASGWHFVSLERSGYASTDTLLYLEPERTTVLSLTLTSLGGGASPEAERPSSAPAAEPAAERPIETGELQIETTPSRVPVRIDGVAAGVSPLIAGDLAPGAHEVTLDLEGYALQTLRVVVSPGRRAAVSAELVPLTGTLSVMVRPWGSIYVDGALRARDTDVRHHFDVPVGTHQVRVVHPLLGVQELSVDVEANQRSPVTFDLH